MSTPSETVTATREQLESAIQAQASEAAQVLAQNAINQTAEQYQQHQDGLVTYANNYVEQLETKHAEERKHFQLQMDAMQLQNAQLQAAWEAAQEQTAALQRQFEELQSMLRAQTTAPTAAAVPAQVPALAPGPPSASIPTTTPVPVAPAPVPVTPGATIFARDTPAPLASSAHRDSLATSSQRFHPYTQKMPQTKLQRPPRKVEPYEMPKSKRPEALDSQTEEVLRTHFWALTGCLEPNATIPPPDPIEKARVLAQFTSEAQVEAAASGPKLIPLDLVQCAQKATSSQSRGKRAGHIRHLPQAALDIMQAYCAQHGITRLAPDPYEAHDSVWNFVNCNVWIGSLRECIIAGHYRFLHVNPTFASAARLPDLRAMYNHMALHVQADRTRKEATRPGNALQRAQLDAARRGRERTRKYRLDAAILRGDPKRQIKALGSLSAHEETRINPRTQESERCSIPHRSSTFTAYVEDLDAWLQENATCYGRQQPPKRVKPSVQPAPLTKWLPNDACIDFWDPDWFNARPLTFRLRAANLWVALPGDVPYNPTNPAILLSDAEFNEHVGKPVVAHYNLVQQEGGDDEDDEDEQDLLGEGDEDMT